MAKRRQNNILLYEAISKDRKKKGLLDRFRRSSSIKKRSLDPITKKPALEEKKQKAPNSPENGPVSTADWPGEVEKEKKAAYNFKFAFVRFFGAFRNIRHKKIYLISILSVTLVILLAYKGFQMSGMQNNNQNQQNNVENENFAGKIPDSSSKQGAESVSMRELLERPVGDHVIVIVQYPEKQDLEPVKAYFAQNGIETVIKQSGKFYFLLTEKKYQSPKKPDSDGKRALDEIKRVGAEYEAPTGFETFGKIPFQDAYGMKLK